MANMPCKMTPAFSMRRLAFAARVLEKVPLASVLAKTLMEGFLGQHFFCFSYQDDSLGREMGLRRTEFPKNVLQLILIVETTYV